MWDENDDDDDDDVVVVICLLSKEEIRHTNAADVQRTLSIIIKSVIRE